MGRGKRKRPSNFSSTSSGGGACQKKSKRKRQRTSTNITEKGLRNRPNKNLHPYDDRNMESNCCKTSTNNELTASNKDGLPAEGKSDSINTGLLSGKKAKSSKSLVTYQKRSTMTSRKGGGACQKKSKRNCQQTSSNVPDKGLRNRPNKNLHPYDDGNMESNCSKTSTNNELTAPVSNKDGLPAEGKSDSINTGLLSGTNAKSSKSLITYQKRSKITIRNGRITRALPTKIENLSDKLDSDNVRKDNTVPGFAANFTDMKSTTTMQRKKNQRKGIKKSQPSAFLENRTSLSGDVGMGSVSKISGEVSPHDNIISVVVGNSGLADASADSNINKMLCLSNSQHQAVYRRRKSKRKGKKKDFNLEVDLEDNVLDATKNSCKVKDTSSTKNKRCGEKERRTISCSDTQQIFVDGCGTFQLLAACGDANEPKSITPLDESKRMVEEAECTIPTEPAFNSAIERSNARECYSPSVTNDLQAVISYNKEVVCLPMSPIQGGIKDFDSLVLAPKRNNNRCSGDEVCASFSFQTAEKVLVDASSMNLLQESYQSGSEAGSENVKLSIPENKATIEFCNNTETINGQEKEVASSSINHVRKDVLHSNANKEKNKKLESLILPIQGTMKSCPRRKLIILDLNGILVDVVQGHIDTTKPHKIVSGKSVFKRPYCVDFLKFCFERFDIGVWSSRKRYNVDAVVDYLMGNLKHKLLFCWDQSQCTKTGYRTIENMHKPLVLKELKKLWDKYSSDLPWDKGEYSPSNTLLVDDSPYKAICNPPHTAIFPEPYYFYDENDNSLGPGGDLRLYLEGLAMADDVQLYVQEHPFGQNAIADTNPYWTFYLQIINKVQKSLKEPVQSSTA